MKVLAVETSGSNCSVSIIDENTVIAEFSCNTGTTHSQNLMPMVDQVLKFANIDLNDIDVLSSSIGPGSFTGLRIGIATIKGLALSLNKKVVGVPSLLGLAYSVPYFDGIICSVLDAKNNNVYAALYEITNTPTQIGEYISDSVDKLIEELQKYDKNILFIGDGAVTYKNRFKEIFGNRANFVPYHLNFQNATSVAKCALDKATIGELTDYNSINPLYLKKSQAERMLEEKK